MDLFPMIVLQPSVGALGQPWAPPMSLSGSPPPTPSGMSSKAKAFTIDALLGLHSQKAFPVSPPMSPVYIFQGDSTNTTLRDAPGKFKRHRTVFMESQLQRLEEEFQQQQYLVGPQRRQLAKELVLSDLQLKVWFQNRRIKWRKNQRNSDESASCSSSSDSE